MAHKTGFTTAARKAAGWAGVVAATLCSTPAATRAQQPAPTVYDTNLAVRSVVSGLNQPIGVAFLGPDSYFIIEKASGQVKWVRPVARRADDHGRARPSREQQLRARSAEHRAAPELPDQPRGLSLLDGEQHGCRFGCRRRSRQCRPRRTRLERRIRSAAVSTASCGTARRSAFAQNLLVIRSFQADPTQPLRGNHNGGVIKFAREGGRARLYVVMGDQGRRGQMQNLEFGAPADPILHPNFPDDDQFGGPEPDQAHLSGVVLRLNDDGSAPDDNPFFNYGRELINGGKPPSAQLQKVFAYGVRNSFGLDIDPASGDVWIQENGDDSFSELNRVVPGQNGGWVQVAGPVSRIAEFKAIESGTFFLSPGKYAGMQQVRFPATLLADTPDQVLSRLFMLPGATYHEPEFSWRFEIAPGGMGFLRGRNLGPQYENDLFMGAAVPAMDGGYLFHFNLTGNRRKIGVDDPRIADRVADNLEKHNFTPPAARRYSGSSRASRSASVATSASRPTSRPARTAICTSCR